MLTFYLTGYLIGFSESHLKSLCNGKAFSVYSKCVQEFWFEWDDHQNLFIICLFYDIINFSHFQLLLQNYWVSFFFQSWLEGSFRVDIGINAGCLNICSITTECFHIERLEFGVRMGPQQWFEVLRRNIEEMSLKLFFRISRTTSL